MKDGVFVCRDVSALHYDPSREEHAAFETKTNETKERYEHEFIDQICYISVSTNNDLINQTKMSLTNLY